jgi:NitT/TauT family transport system permease protein
MKLLAINAQPGKVSTFVLSWILFVTGIALYFYASVERHKENPDDRVVPTITQLGEGLYDAALGAPDGRSLPARFFDSMLWLDTVASAKRFGWAMILLVPAVILGLHVGMFPYIGVFFLRFILFFDKIIALSVLPILFIAFGIDELSKVMLIVIGVTPTIILDTINLTKGVPKEQIVKGFTLGASDFAIAYRVVLKQIFPRILNSIRLNLKAIMLFLFAGEMIASTDGLAYRIALLLLFLVDWTMRTVNQKLHPWFREN